MLDDRNQRAAVRLIKGAATRAGLTRIVELRTCDNCAQSESKDPKCGLCAGPTSTITRWEPKP
jgi:hypothetical protein